MKLLLSFLLLTNFNSFAADKTKAGQDKGNGGDICENKMREVATEIESWLLGDEFKGIKLPGDISEYQYKEKMLEAIKKSTLSCTTDKLFIGAAEKTCKNYEDTKGNQQVVCNFERFLKTEEKEKFKLVHHEFAGVAGFEKNNGSESSVYEISNQISDFLDFEMVQKLGIKKKSQRFQVGDIVLNTFNESPELHVVFAIIDSEEVLTISVDIANNIRSYNVKHLLKEVENYKTITKGHLIYCDAFKKGSNIVTIFENGYIQISLKDGRSSNGLTLVGAPGSNLPNPYGCKFYKP